jgi:VWFA-related protein
MIRTAGFLAAVLAFSFAVFGQEEPTRAPSRLPSTDQAALGASENHGNPPAQELVKLSARSDLVLVPVIVNDKSGKHVSGLRKEAFQVEEDGKLRAISVFEEVKTENAAGHVRVPTSGEHSNFSLDPGHPWRVSIVCLDMINSPWVRQLEAKRQLTDYLLRTALRDEPLALFALTGRGLRQVHPFARDTKVLVAALQKLKLSLSAQESTFPPDSFTPDPLEQEQASDEEQLLSDTLADQDAAVSANYQRLATRETLLAMNQLARAFQALPGRKTLIWASAGFPFIIDDPESFARLGDDLRLRYEATWRALESANIAVYSVDLNALEYTAAALPSANTGISSTKIADIRGSGPRLRSPLRFPYDQGAQQRLTLHAFADATGGRACITLEELERCFAEAVEDSRAYYLLGYYLGGETQPGWRRLKIKAAQGNLKLRYRTGFYVTPKIPDTPEFRRQQLVDALASPVEYTGLRLTARLLSPASGSPSGSSAEAKKPAEFMLGVTGDSIAIDRGNGNAINLEVTTLAFDSDRKGVAGMSQAISTKFDSARVQKIIRTGIGIPEKIDLPPGKYEVKFAVRDNLSGVLGTISVPLELK